MDPQDDPEARIRELERPLSEQARELGTPQSGDYTGTPPPVYSSTDGTLPPPLPPPPPPPGAWGAGYSPASSPAASGTFNPTVRTPSASLRIGWVVLGIFLVVGVIVAGGVWMAVSRVSSGIDEFTSNLPSFDSPSPQTGGAVPTATAAAPVNLAGANERLSAVCDGGAVTVSGVSNTIEITGSCSQVTVSGVDNTVRVESAAVIDASGFDNRVTYLSGNPTINNTGDNVVEQG